MARRFRIHPAIGVARIGNSPDGFFVGPEHPSIPANWGEEGFDSFRDAQGRIKRQAARFRVFEYIDDGTGRFTPREVRVGGDIEDIEWRVHLANRKGSFFTFNGQSGAEDDVYVARANKSPAAPEVAAPPRSNRRNASVPADRRRELLEIDPGEKLVSRSSPGPVILRNPNTNVPFISDLGEIRVEVTGHLLVFGGRGTSGSTATPPVEIDEYANNDTWFDDVGDGSVKARVRLADGSSVDADAAWIIVGPPDFAPSVGQPVSLYDLLWDIAVRVLPQPFGPLFLQANMPELMAQKTAWAASGQRSLAGYVPSFTREVYPILSRALAVRSLHQPREIESSYHLQLDWAVLAAQDGGDPFGPDPAALREYVFSRVRNPAAERVDWSGMPRGLGDDYDALDTEPKPTSLFSLTRLQYAVLEQWSLGNFKNDWSGDEPSVPARGAVIAAGLDRAALENCVGGPFFPGIEVGWLVRRTELYLEPFRLKVPSAPAEESGPPLVLGALSFVPGFFSQQMAQPWQADFYDCQKEEHEGRDQRPYLYMWWTAQRPDDVFPPGEDTLRPWARHLVPPGMAVEDLDRSNARFSQMVLKWHELRFIIQANDRLEEEPPPKNTE